MTTDNNQLEYDIYWHALNYRTATTLGAEAMWQELQACVNRLLSAKDAEIARLKAQLESTATASFNNLLALNVKEAELSRLQADAERYRYLRAQPSAPMHDVGWQVRHHWRDGSEESCGRPHFLSTMCLSGESLDRGIDCAISQQQGEGLK